MIELIKSIIGDLGTEIVLFIFAMGTIVTALELTGFLPNRFIKYFAKKKLQSQILILEEMGVNFPNEKKTRLLSQIRDYSTEIRPYHLEVKEIIKKFTYKKYKGFKIGKTAPIISHDFIDLMSASTSPQYAKQLAQMLSSYLTTLEDIYFDFVITPKNGSPLIGYEFSQLVKRPFIMHVDSEEKFESSSNHEFNIFSKFDCSDKSLLDRKRAIIVDDSTTGGRKVLNIVNDLRALNCEVSICLVIFAPKSKGVSEKLGKNSITLHHITQI